MPPSQTPPRRAPYLDLFKTVLVWGMVSAHVIQLLGLRLGPGAGAFSDYVNLISFSGFMLAFGIGTGLSRGARRRALAERAWPVLVMLAAVYISSLGFVVLSARRPVTPDLLADLLSFRVLFGYSEFLASFLVLYLLIALARPVLVAIAEHPLFLAVAIAACLASTYVTTDQLIPFAGTLIGHRKYASFPLLAYLPWFLAGIRLGRRDGVLPPLDLALAAIATAAFGWFFWRAGFWLPERFPPSVLWIVGPALILALYLFAARAVTDWASAPSLLLAPGRHVLASLLFSNLAIFTAQRLFYKPARSLWMAGLIALALLAAVTLWGAAIDRLGRRGGRRG
jgi:hypothetical protein